MDGLVIEKDSVGLFAVIAQAFAMVGHDRKHCAIIKSARAQGGKQLADDRIRVGDLAIVGIFRETLFVGRRWIVRIVRVIEMNPQEKWPLLVRIQPGESTIDDFCPAALDGFVTVGARARM